MRLKWLSYPLVALAATVVMAIRPDLSAQCDAPEPHVPLVRAEDPKADEKVEPKYPRGRVAPTEEQLKTAHDAAKKRHDHRVKRLPEAAPASFDCRTMGWVGPVQNQADCGSCWDVATCGVITNSYIKAGYGKNDGTFVLSPQFILDCTQNGGCNGDWGTTVLNIAKSKGIPLSSDYGPYTARPGSCKLKSGTKMYTIADFGFCTPGQEEGISSTQDIKNCIAQYGPVATALAANSDWDNYRSGVIPYRKLSPNSVNHEVSIIGWDDSKVAPNTTAKGAFLVLNQWGESWGEKGCIWIPYGSHQIGTECAWVTVTALPPPPPPGPTPPDPIPPSPPTPGGGFTGTIAKVQTYKDGVPVGPELTVVGGAPSGGGLEAELKTAGVDPVIITDVLQLITDLKNKAGFAKILADVLKIVTDLGVLKEQGKIGRAPCGEAPCALAA